MCASPLSAVDVVANDTPWRPICCFAVVKLSVCIHATCIRGSIESGWLWQDRSSFLPARYARVRRASLLLNPRVVLVSMVDLHSSVPI